MPASAPARTAAGLGMRTVRHRKPENFLSALRRNGHGIAEEAPLSPAEAADEALVMGLRLAEGIDAGRASPAGFGLPAIVDWSARRAAGRFGPLMRDGARIALTPRGRLVLDHILGEIARRASLGFWRLRSAQACVARRGRGVALGASCRRHELIIVGRGRDIIVDRHFARRKPRPCGSCRSSSGTRSRRLSASPSARCRRSCR